MQIWRNSEAVLGRIGERQLELVLGSETLVRLEKRDQLTENFAHVAAIDLVNDQHVLRGEGREAKGRGRPRLVQRLLDPAYSVHQFGLPGRGGAVQSEKLRVNQPQGSIVISTAAPLLAREERGSLLVGQFVGFRPNLSAMLPIESRILLRGHLVFIADGDDISLAVHLASVDLDSAAGLLNDSW